MWVGGEGHLCPGPDVVRGSVHLVREADAAPRELVADRRVMSRRSPERAHARIPEHSRQVREIDAIWHVAEQDRPAVEEETHGTGLSKGRAGDGSRSAIAAGRSLRPLAHDGPEIGR